MTSSAHLRSFLARELGRAVRARWLLMYAAVFLVGGALLIVLGSTGSVIGGYRGYARALASLAHLAILFVPLMALFPAAASVAEDRENGTLEYLLAQPVTWSDVYGGKWIGTAAAVILALSVGYLTSGGVAVLNGVPPLLVAETYVLLLLLALAFVSLGTLLSALSDTRARAVTRGLAAWLVFVALGSLGSMAAFIRWGVPESALVAWSLINPVEAFRLGVLVVLDPDLQLLGPIGIRLARSYGSGAIVGAAATSLVAWTVVPLLLGTRVDRWRRDGV